MNDITNSMGKTKPRKYIFYSYDYSSVQTYISLLEKHRVSPSVYSGEINIMPIVSVELQSIIGATYDYAVAQYDGMHKISALSSLASKVGMPTAPVTHVTPPTPAAKETPMEVGEKVKDKVGVKEGISVPTPKEKKEIRKSMIREKISLKKERLTKEEAVNRLKALAERVKKEKGGDKSEAYSGALGSTTDMPRVLKEGVTLSKYSQLRDRVKTEIKGIKSVKNINQKKKELKKKMTDLTKALFRAKTASEREKLKIEIAILRNVLSMLSKKPSSLISSKKKGRAKDIVDEGLLTSVVTKQNREFVAEYNHILAEYRDTLRHYKIDYGVLLSKTSLYTSHLSEDMIKDKLAKFNAVLTNFLDAIHSNISNECTSLIAKHKAEIETFENRLKDVSSARKGAVREGNEGKKAEGKGSKHGAEAEIPGYLKDAILKRMAAIEKYKDKFDALADRIDKEVSLLRSKAKKIVDEYIEEMHQHKIKESKIEEKRVQEVVTKVSEEGKGEEVIDKTVESGVEEKNEGKSVGMNESEAVSLIQDILSLDDRSLLYYLYNNDKETYRKYTRGMIAISEAVKRARRIKAKSMGIPQVYVEKYL